ncbi:serine protease snake-like [Schistocerca serialis cubense]|uniref:serine protease snake-like n=1 Tax=Schistocerca serialis cubense TaxID=2023355 RepID=UPI00214DFE1E|nr:serine protease snake-like [Schistocerca serialis cubense]
MGSGTIAFVVLAASATASAIIFSEDAKPSVYNDLVCQLPDGSGGLCRVASDCPSASSAEACVAKGLVCCPSTTTSPAPATGVGIKSRQECEKSAQLATVNECPPIEMTPGKNIAVPGLFPYLAVLGYGNLSDSKWLYAGVLVSESSVLTSARCLGDCNLGIVRRVRLGDVDLTTPNGDDETVQLINVDKVTPHPLYKPLSAFHDVAVLHLQTPAKLSSRVRPACLNSLTQLPTNRVIIAGFAAESNRSTEFGTARYVDVTEIPALQCQKALPVLTLMGVGINESLICAADEAGGRGSCRDDLGSPLQVRLDKPHCQFSVAGLRSFGSLVCGKPGVPAVYTSIAEYLEWIESVVWP